MHFIIRQPMPCYAQSRPYPAASVWATGKRRSPFSLQVHVCMSIYHSARFINCRSPGKRFTNISKALTWHVTKIGLIVLAFLRKWSQQHFAYATRAVVSWKLICLWHSDSDYSEPEGIISTRLIIYHIKERMNPNFWAFWLFMRN